METLHGWLASPLMDNFRNATRTVRTGRHKFELEQLEQRLVLATDWSAGPVDRLDEYPNARNESPSGVEVGEIQGSRLPRLTINPSSYSESEIIVRFRTGVRTATAQ